jgi:hypothetical protein
MKVPTGLSIDESLLKNIDDVRGDVPRSVILQNLIERGLSTGGISEDRL